MTSCWVGDGLVPLDQAGVSVLDHGFTVGDGIFETVLVRAGVPTALTRHLRRLRRSAEGLGLTSPDESLLRRAVAAVVGAADPDARARGRLRITVTSGPGPLGSDRGDAPPTIVVTLASAAEWPSTTAVVTVPWVRNERSATAGLKTTSYAENAAALAVAKRVGASEALLANTRGELCEGTGTNVVVVVDGVARTPPLSSGCLAGITRELLLEWCPQVQEETLPYDVLTRADEVLLLSSTRDVLPVVRVDDRAVEAGPVGAALRDAYAAHLAATPDPD